MYYCDRSFFLSVGGGGGGGQDSTGAIPRRQDGFYLVIFYYPLKTWGLCSTVPVGENSQL